MFLGWLEEKWEEDRELTFEDIPPHSRDFSHELGGNPIKGPQFLAQKTNEKSYLLY